MKEEPIVKEEDNQMSKFELINASCADQTVDAIVNAANSSLWAGGGICGVIFRKAGTEEHTRSLPLIIRSMIWK